MTAPYYDPEKWGLEEVAEIDYSSGNYEFDYRVVWRHKETGKFYTARDAGCSCPSPFEDYLTLEDLDEIQSVEGVLRQEVAEELVGSAYITAEEAQDFLRKVEKAMGEN